VNASLFDNFDAIKRNISNKNKVETKSGTSAIKRKNRHLTRRAKSEEVLRSILPDSVDVGDSYHVMSSGDVDSMSFMTFYMINYKFDEVLISTWVIADSDIDNLIDMMRRQDQEIKVIFGGNIPRDLSCRIFQTSKDARRVRF